jgi:hydrogenase maturation factor
VNRIFEALTRASKYSFITNKLGYCGKEGSFSLLQDFIDAPSAEKEAAVKTALESFFGLHSYLKLIARCNNLEPFDERVIEAYWIGNRLLERVSLEALRETILSGLVQSGLPKQIAEKKASQLSPLMQPHHSFHVLHINFITKKLAPLVKNLSDCLIQWAEVKAVEEKKFLVKGIELLEEGCELKLKEREKRIGKGFALSAEKGDFVSVHWNSAIEILDEEQLKNLKKFTLKNLLAANSI